ncbi:glycosyl hydrolase family 43 protein [Thozetella sp. PMI_491]|nr:glycosyl hydrolase family 43 protein [Thozetella sp. PMI_491]
MLRFGYLVAAVATLLSPLPVVGSVVRRQTVSFTSDGNPILADGSIYSADPAPLVVNNTLYIISGRDEAGPGQNDFIMNQWQIFETSNPNPGGGSWTLHQNVAQPQTLFGWASAGTAYASQVVQGSDGKYYLYAPVTQSGSPNADPFAIGVAVSDSPLGPFKDAHPGGPIISQSVPPPGDSIQNIDPTVFVDSDGRVFIYFGTFGQLRGYELEKDMITIKGSVVTVQTLTGYFEAPWLMKRGSTYYMLYAANNAGQNSPCTPTSYHACLAYGTSSSPLGPWTFRGVFLDIVSSTTSHPGAFELNGNWFLVYHTRDAVGGTHFRRSIAMDKLEWDESTSPPSIVKVKQTKRPGPPRQPTRNIAPSAKPTSANPTPIQYWIAAINDERVESNPLPPDYWCSWAAELSPQTNILTYTWNSTVSLNGVSMAFFADQPAGSNIGVAPPVSWSVQYLTANDTPEEVSFNIVQTTALRAILNASGGNGQFAAVGVKEWRALAPVAS